MRISNYRPGFLLVGLAILETMRHTGTDEITADTSVQMNGPKAGEFIEKKPEFLTPPPTLEPVIIYFEKCDLPFNPLIKLKTKGSGRKRFTEVATNTAPLRHYKNPQRFRRG